MAKRLTDTEKWKDDWYISLCNDDKIVWQWLLDNCSHAGICKPSIGLLNLMCRVNYTEQQMTEKMEGRVFVRNNVWFIPKFIKFQYAGLKSAKPVIVSVVKELFNFDLIELIPQSFGDDYIIKEKSFFNHCKMIKDKDKDKDKSNDKEEKGGAGEKGDVKIDAGTKVLLVPELLAIWKQSSPDYVSSAENDFPALRSIAESLAIRMNIVNYTDFEGVNEIKKAFQLIVNFIKKDSFYKDHQLNQVDRYFNAITSKMKSEHEEKKVGKNIVQTNLNAAQNARNIVAEKYGKQTNN